MAERRTGAFALLPACVLVAYMLLPSAAVATDYRQVDGSRLAFAGEYDGAVFAGRFEAFDTTLQFDPARPQDARLDVVVVMASVGSDSRERDETLRDAAFFAVSRFPEARFTASGFVPEGDGHYLAHGRLQLRGTTAPLTLRITWQPGTRPVMQARATVPRLRFGIGAGDWADTDLLPDPIAVSAKVVLEPATPLSD